MIDYHSHLEKGDLEQAWVHRFLENWRKRGISEFGFSEHAYLFTELAPLYEGNLDFSDTPLGRRQREWFEAKAFRWSLHDYFALMEKLKTQEVPVKIGLELDWFSGCGSLIKELLAPWPLDYSIGSVHWLDGWAFDLWQDSWQGRDPGVVWSRYFTLVTEAVASQSFSVLGHADLIKVFGYYPAALPVATGDALARTLASARVAAEINPALHYRGQSPYYCPSPWLLELFFERQVMITFGSDAHQPEQAGLLLAEAREYARRAGYSQAGAFNKGQVVMTSL